MRQPGAMPVNVVSPGAGDPDAGPPALPRGRLPVKALLEAGAPRLPPRRRCEERARMANMAPKTTRTTHEPCPKYMGPL